MMTLQPVPLDATSFQTYQCTHQLINQSYILRLPSAALFLEFRTPPNTILLKMANNYSPCRATLEAAAGVLAIYMGCAVSDSLSPV